MDIAHDNGSTSTEVAVRADLDMGPVVSIVEAQKVFEQVRNFIKGELKDGEDYGITPGTPKPALYQPGAEKLCFFFGLGIQYEHVAGEVTPTRVAHTYKCRLVSLRTGQVKAECEGSCNSDEGNYQRAYAKMAEKQGVTDVRALDNTIRKMAQKRSFVGATRTGTASSSYFSTVTEAGEDEEGNGHGQPAETRLCSIHNAQMIRRISQKTGNPYWSHPGPDGKLCFGGKDDDKALATPAPQAQASTTGKQATAFDANTIPTGKGAMLNWIEQGRIAKGMARQDLEDMVRKLFMRSAVSQCEDAELATLCGQLQHKWLNTPEPEPAA